MRSTQWNDLLPGGPGWFARRRPAHRPGRGPQGPDPALVERARKLLDQVPLVDGHNDLPWEYRKRVEEPLRQDRPAERHLAARAAAPHRHPAPAQGAASAASSGRSTCRSRSPGPDAVQAMMEQIDVVHRLAERYPDTFEMARTADDIVRIHKAGKIASLIGMEGGHSINNSLAVLRQLYAAGARYMTLTHSKNTDWADSATDAPQARRPHPLRRGGGARDEPPRHAGRPLARLAETMKDALAVSQAPVIFSHSSARASTPTRATCRTTCSSSWRRTAAW